MVVLAQHVHMPKLTSQQHTRACTHRLTCRQLLWFASFGRAKAICYKYHTLQNKQKSKCMTCNITNATKVIMVSSIFLSTLKMKYLQVPAAVLRVLWQKQKPSMSPTPVVQVHEQNSCGQSAIERNKLRPCSLKTSVQNGYDRKG